MNKNFDPEDKDTKNIIEKYKAFFEFAMNECGYTSLSLDESLAVEKRVLDECIETAFNKQKNPSEERSEIRKQFDELLRKECPDMIFDTFLEFDKEGFSKKR